MPVSTARPQLSCKFSRPTRHTAYELFTPNNSGQRSHPTCYRGCWHVVGRCFFSTYRQTPKRGPSSMAKEVYNPKAVIPHAASLRQASAHCAIFPTAASRRSLGRVSVPVWPVALSGRLPVTALVSHHPTNKLIGRGPIPSRQKHKPLAFHHQSCNQQSYPVLDPVSQAYPKAEGRSPTCYSPVRRSSTHPKAGISARLACVKHAASVRPEPGSNSPTKPSPTKSPATHDGITRAEPNIKLAQHHQSPKNKLDTLLSSQKTPAHQPRRGYALRTGASSE